MSTSRSTKQHLLTLKQYEPHHKAASFDIEMLAQLGLGIRNSIDIHHVDTLFCELNREALITLRFKYYLHWH